MEKIAIFFIAVYCIASPMCNAFAMQEKPTAAQFDLSEKAFDYVLEAISIMREHSYRSDQLDWDSIRTQMLEKARGAEETKDTYDAIRFGTRLLGDRHSMFRPPRKPGSENAPMRSDFEIPLPKGKVLKGGIAYIWIPHFGQRGERVVDFADMVHVLVKTLNRYQPKGWIVDLRDNGGGNMWPMVAGLGPLLGEGPIGHFTFRGETLHTWRYENGSSSMHTDGEQKFAVGVSVEPIPALGESISIAVLTGPHTSSSGEATLVAFMGKENVRTFGLPTFGVPSANRGHPLSDGATLIISSSFYSDRLGREYKSSIPADTFVPYDTLSKSTRDSEDDPVIKRARKWIDEHQGGQK